MREIEIKLRVKDLVELEQKLKDSGCMFSKKIKQHDVIYTDVKNHGGFEKTKEGNVVMRIRNEDGVSKLTLKQQKSNEMDNIEYETEVKDANEIHQMLEVLGWKPEVEVKKIRKTGKLGEFAVCLDRVEELGAFVEIEKLTDDNANPEDVRKELFNAIGLFGLSEADEEIKGYDTLIYQLKKKQ